MKKNSFLPLLALLLVSGVSAQSGGGAPSVSVIPSHTTFSPAGGQIGFNVTLNYPAGSIPSFQVKPPGADWLFVGIGGPDLPPDPPRAGESTNSADPSSSFGFYYISPPESGSASFSFVISYPPNLTSNPTIVLRANFQLNGLNTIPVNNVTLTPQGASAPAPVVVSLQPVLTKVGDKASFSVLAAGVGALSYQWIKAGADVSGATNANFDIGKVAAADAVSYSVRVQSGGGSTTSSAVGLSVLTAASPIVPGSRFTISGLNLPSTGAAAVAVDGIVLLNPSLSAQAISADVPSTMTVGAIEKSVGVSIGGLGSASFGVGFHNADTANPRWSLTLPELLRVIAFFNTKYTGTDGSVRQTGCYKVETTNLTDGFAVDSSVSAPAAAGQGSLSRYHSADTDKNGAISLSELLRVIAFFNTRYAKTDGTISQTGFYRVQFGTVDGYGTDPARAP